MQYHEHGFDFTGAMRRLCEDVCERLDVFQHINMDEIVVTYAQARRKVSWGLQAKLTPLRFEGGTLETNREGQRWKAQRLFQGRREMLYMLTFYLPRFQEQTFSEKMVTVLHELYHISPEFNGDIRRLPGRCYVHSMSEKEYDLLMAKYVRAYLAMKPPRELFDFLRFKFSTLERKFGQVVGLQVPIPKMLPIDEARSA
ncbi:hypothetical protein Pla110_34700 [Polystyrenella longa]|uniref:Uncharacterized protein n=1 Tax=Polystyrenella longa TaxID=2528007 RepID=A0A518CR83_9PLAN|nr:putative metallopeptidase [Polystyrenella longa]QDU81725.1 hypothetical protein Pla110_34700 [Polystyrenella longa]